MYVNTNAFYAKQNYYYKKESYLNQRDVVLGAESTIRRGKKIKDTVCSP